jgi:hypothetical protein
MTEPDFAPDELEQAASVAADMAARPARESEEDRELRRLDEAIHAERRRRLEARWAEESRQRRAQEAAREAERQRQEARRRQEIATSEQRAKDKERAAQEALARHQQQLGQVQKEWSGFKAGFEDQQRKAVLQARFAHIDQIFAPYLRGPTPEERLAAIESHLEDAPGPADADESPWAKYWFRWWAGSKMQSIYDLRNGGKRWKTNGRARIWLRNRALVAIQQLSQNGDAS